MIPGGQRKLPAFSLSLSEEYEQEKWRAEECSEVQEAQGAAGSRSALPLVQAEAEGI
jgi:hypothetical protein